VTKQNVLGSEEICAAILGNLAKSDQWSQSDRDWIDHRDILGSPWYVTTRDTAAHDAFVFWA
jgi:hypothetical protein